MKKYILITTVFETTDGVFITSFALTTKKEYKLITKEIKSAFKSFEGEPFTFDAIYGGVIKLDSYEDVKVAVTISELDKYSAKLIKKEIGLDVGNASYFDLHSELMDNVSIL